MLFIEDPNILPPSLSPSPQSLCHYIWCDDHAVIYDVITITIDGPSCPIPTTLTSITAVGFQPADVVVKLS